MYLDLSGLLSQLLEGDLQLKVCYLSLSVSPSGLILIITQHNSFGIKRDTRSEIEAVDLFGEQSQIEDANHP